MRKNPLFLLLALILCNTAFSQDAKQIQMDSLMFLSDKSLDSYHSGNYNDVIKYSAKIIDKAVALDNKYYEFVGYDSQATLYYTLDDTINAIINAEKALEIAKETKIDSLISWSYLNLGSLYSENKKVYEKGITYLKKSLEIYKRENKIKDVTLIYINLAWTYLDHDRSEEAYSYLKKIETIEKEHFLTKEYKAYVEFLFGKYYFNVKKYNIAEKKLSMASVIIDKDSFIDLGRKNYKLLSEIYSKKNDFKNAYLTLEKFNHYTNKVYTVEKLKQIEKESAKYNLKEYQKNIEGALEAKKLSDELFKKTNYIKTIFIIASIILLFALIGFYLMFKARKKNIYKLRAKNIELIKAKEKAEQLSKVKTQFFSTVSHELRTPLYGVIGLATILQEDKKLEENHKRDLKSLKFSADYLLALINDVLLINKMEAKAINLKKATFQLDDLVIGIGNSFKFRLEQNKNKLHLNIDKRIPNHLIGDAVRLSQILMNLLGNAIKFNENGNIWLSIELKEKADNGLCTLYFEIKDDGIGISKDKQKVIFEEFSQVLDGNYSIGTGLGLPIVKKLLKLHNSDIYLNSELGKGSVFSFTIELFKDNNINPSQLQPKSDINAITNAILSQYQGAKVLVVDDNKINQKVTQRMLHRVSIQSDLANDGEEAINMAKVQPYALVLMDINMPKVNGIEATRVIRTFNKEIPIIALTAIELEEGMRIKILDSGMNDILSKPYDISQFLSTILGYLKP